MNIKKLNELRQIVCEQNKRLFELDLVILTEWNVSARFGDYFAIKPSGVPYKDLTPKKIRVVEMATGKVCKDMVGSKSLSPSVDTPIHLELYRRFPKIGGIAHTHSFFATMFAQACESISCFGTTHADAFYDDVIVTRLLSEEEVATDYEHNIAMAITEVLKPSFCPCVLLVGHGPFAVGASAKESVDNALILEKVAGLAYFSSHIGAKPLPQYFQAKHFFRKHGQRASYGQVST